MREEFVRLLDIIRSGEVSQLEPPSFLEFSNASHEEIAAFTEVWFTLDADYRLRLADLFLGAEKEDDPPVFLEPLLAVLFDDELPAVRAAAIAALDECVEEDLARRILNILQTDASAEVRAQAATALGSYLYWQPLGESEEKPELTRQIEDALLETINTIEEDITVRQRALESYVYADDPFIEDILEEAYDSDEDEMRTSAVFAMGRHGDESWLSIIHNEMRSASQEMRMAAVFAAEEIGSSSSVPHLLRIIAEDEDADVRMAAVYALVEIDSPEARRLLEDLTESNEAIIAAAAIDALEMRDSWENPDDFLMFDFNMFEEHDPGGNGHLSVQGAPES